MKVYAKELRVGQEIIGKLCSLRSGDMFFTSHMKKENKPLKILKIENTIEVYMNGRYTEIKSFVLTFEEGEVVVSGKQKFELNNKGV